MKTEQIIEAAADAAREKKAEDPVVLDLRGLSSLADYFFICSGKSTRQVKAIAEGIDATLRAGGRRPGRVEGLAESRWVVLDFGDILVHVFLEEARSYYSLETLWGDAPRSGDGASGMGNGEWGMGGPVLI
jgi:ribosome-associated protein